MLTAIFQPLFESIPRLMLLDSDMGTERTGIVENRLQSARNRSTGRTTVGGRGARHPLPAAAPHHGTHLGPPKATAHVRLGAARKNFLPKSPLITWWQAHLAFALDLHSHGGTGAGSIHKPRLAPLASF